MTDRGHEAVDVRDIGLGAADDSVIASHARKNGLCLVTRDKDFGDIRNYPPADYSGIDLRAAKFCQSESKIVSARTPKPARATRALPYGVACASDSSFRGIARFSTAAGTRVPSESMGTFLLAG